MKILNDRWIPNGTSFIAQTPRRRLNEDDVVADISDNDTKWWNFSNCL
jgi:hypothetical protein